MVSRQGSIFVTPLVQHRLSSVFAPILKLYSILSLKKFWEVWFPFPKLFWIILSLTQGADTEDPEDILGAGYWAQQPIWDTARSAASLSWYHYHGIIHPPLASLASQVICRNRTIYYNFFLSQNIATKYSQTNSSAKKTLEKFRHQAQVEGFCWVNYGRVICPPVSELSGHHIVMRRKGKPRHIPRPLLLSW